MKRIICLAGAAFLHFMVANNEAYGQAKIKAYFNHPVNTSVSTGVDAVYLPSGTMADTIVAYINRAKYTLDVAQYDYNQDNYYGSYANIATAVNNAYNRGVTVRWIYDGSESNTGLASLNSAIHKLARPETSSGAIMHNKFIIIDANSTNPDDAIVFTGSADWSSEMFYKDYNNVLFIQDSALAYAYTAEFNMMWGSTTATPDASLAKFGNAKTDLGLHMFTIAGHTVELYFSPSDNTDTHISNSILTANTDLYVGVYCFTRTGDANNIVSMKNSGVYTLATVDQYTPTSSPAVNSILSSGLGTNYIVYHTSYIYHNKMMIVDPSNACSDPQVLTGSHNWTSSANEINDENIVIVHNDTLANIYYQSYISDFVTIGGGSFTPITGCGDTVSTSGVKAINNTNNAIALYPNPASTELTISGNEKITSVVITNLLGQTVCNNTYNSEEVYMNIAALPAGIYMARINGSMIRKFVKE